MSSFLVPKRSRNVRESQGIRIELTCVIKWFLAENHLKAMDDGHPKN